MGILVERTFTRCLSISALLGLLILICLTGCSDKETEVTIPVQAVETSTSTAEPLAVPTSTPEQLPVEPTEASEPAEMFVEEETAVGGGGRIVFSSEREEKYSYDLYTMLPDGSEVTRITNTSDESELSASWSPDGKQIVYESRSPTRTSYLYVMDIETGERTMILKSNRYAGDPDWTEAGIVYFEGRCKIEDCSSDMQEMTTEIYVIQPDGSGRTALTFTLHRALGPSWSPDFAQIVYSYGTSYSLYLMNADGSDQEALVAIPGDSLDPVWSPDGEWIVFSSNRHDRRDLYMVRPDGTDLTRLTDDPHHDWFPAWSPDGRYIVFTTERYGEAELCLLEVASGEVTRLTDSPLNDKMPDWSP